MKIDVFTITSYKDVCTQLGEKQKRNPFDQIKQLEKFFNPKEWKPNFENGQKNWLPIFKSSHGRLMFDCSLFSYSFCGVAGFYFSEKISNHIGKYFPNIYEKLITK